MNVKTLGFAAALLPLLAAPALAHHSFAMFDATKTLTMSGTVKEFEWTNPHVWIQVEAAGANGAKEEWSIEGGGPNSLSRQGWRPSSFKFGMPVTLRVNPMRDGTHGGLFVGAKFADASTLGRWEAQP